MSAGLKISLSATNPCHLYDLAKALHARGGLARYYSGYPRWKLSPPPAFPLVARSSRTLVTYGCLRLHPSLRPAPHRLFRWQDDGFDRSIARALRADDAAMFHAMPGQALASFRAARAAGISPVLNHASGPVQQQLSLVADEYRRVGISPGQHHGFDAKYFRREAAEYELAERHCVASHIVRQQLVAAGVSADKILVLPYGADPEKFYPPRDGVPRDRTQVVYAGQLSLRKGLRIAFAAFDRLHRTYPLNFHLYGPVNSEMRSTLAGVAGAPWLHLHGPVTQPQLAAVFRRAAMLVLPSWEEAFGLVVVQALSCGLPCIVSDRVGAADLIKHRCNGSIFPAGNSDRLAEEIAWWADHLDEFQWQNYAWGEVASRLLEFTRDALRT